MAFTPKEITQKERNNLMDEHVTLNGVRAKITGRLKKFPHVSQLAFPFQSVEYSWFAVARIVFYKEGAFSTM